MAILLTFIATTTLCFGADPFVGTWKLNPAKTKIVAGNDNSARSIIRPFNLIGPKHVLTDTVMDADGNVAGVAVYDGKEREMFGIPSVHSRIDSNHIHSVYKSKTADSKTDSVWDNDVSADGKTMKLTITGIGSSGRKVEKYYFYDKQ